MRGAIGANVTGKTTGVNVMGEMIGVNVMGEMIGVNVMGEMTGVNVTAETNAANEAEPGESPPLMGILTLIGMLSKVPFYFILGLILSDMRHR